MAPAATQQLPVSLGCGGMAGGLNIAKLRLKRQDQKSLTVNVEQQARGRAAMTNEKLQKIHSFPIMVAILLSITFSFSVQAHSPADPAVYGALPDVSAVRISPDGKTIAMIQTINDESYVVFRQADDPGATPTGLKIGEINARTIEWANNDYLLLMYSQSEREQLVDGITTIEYFRWVTISRKDQKAKVLFGNEGNFVISDPGQFISMVRDKQNTALFSRTSPRGNFVDGQRASRISRDNEIAYSTFTVDLETGSSKLLDFGSPNTVDWVSNRDGEPFMRVDYDRSSETREIYARAPGRSNYDLIVSSEEAKGAGTSIRLYGLIGGTNDVAATLYSAQSDKRALVGLNPETGEFGKTYFNNATYDIDAIMYEPRRAEVTGVRYIDDLPRAHFFNKMLADIQNQLKVAIPGATPMIVSQSADNQRMIVEAIYTDHPKQFFVFDRSEMRLDMLSPSYIKLDGSTYAQKEKFDYVADDGLKIQGYLTVPTGASKNNMPLIVLPHGGPESRSDQAFDYWSFFYAARGYLVYEPNFRGSDGYGSRFRRAGYGEWGRKMQDDITNGVEKLVADGIADPNRICIVGASYGGYAALAGATLTPDSYACAVSVNGVSDLPGMLGDESKDSPLAEDYWEVRMGGTRFSPEELNAVSPSQIADRTGPPVLLIHAKDDIVVPISQSRRMRNALRAAGKPHEYVELKGEDHWLSTGETRTEMLQRSIDFIDRHIGQ